jgi:aerobic carbon-monoxide dehydrogenase large subunit
MDAQSDLAPERFAVGQPVPRSEDPTLLRGEGRYTADLNLPGQAYAVMVRSRVAHGVLRGIDTAAARAMPGVLAVLTGADLVAAGLGPMPISVFGQNRDGSPYPRPVQMALATDRVRYVGDPLAMVVAETVAQAKDAAEMVMPDIDSLPAVTDARAAAALDAPQLYAEAPGNLLLDWHFGDTDAVSEAFASAAHVTKLDLRNNRVVVCAMEPRAAVGDYDEDDERFVLRVGCQGVIGQRALLSGPMAVPAERIRVLTGHVGGSFGMKYTCYPESVCVLHAARLLGRAVKWTDERSDSFLSDSHGRDHDVTAELALDSEGRFLALRVTGYANVGASLGNALTLPPTANIARNIIGVYRTPLVEVSTRCLFTNTTPVGAYRGAGRPEGNYYMERLVEAAARELGIDALELRRRNHISTDMFPYSAPSGQVYDSGDFPALLRHALDEADWDGYADRAADSRARGLVRGRGVGQYLEVTAPASPEMGGIRFEADGTVTILTGTLDYGQGHAAPFAQVLAGALGVPFGAIRLLQGDSDQLIAGGGTGGSRSIMQSGAAILAASDKVIENGRKIAAHLLEAAEADIEFSAGRFTIAGTDRGIGIMEMAAQLRDRADLPADVPTSLDAMLTNGGVPSAFPNGCHIAEVELDPETGHIAVSRYTMVNDFGVEVNPMLVAAQAHGGVVQAIGQALGESVRYDEDGQLQSGSFMDYALPRAVEAPMFSVSSHPTPALTNPLGVKGCGEAGCAGGLPAVMNAVTDALAQLGVAAVNMPATPATVWAAIQARRGSVA